jgi:hypothetical protein
MIKYICLLCSNCVFARVSGRRYIHAGAVDEENSSCDWSANSAGSETRTSNATENKEVVEGFRSQKSLKTTNSGEGVDVAGLQYRRMDLLLGGIIAVLSFFLGAVFRPYLTGYATKKGENLATHEDIDKLVDQVKAVTEATKKIEAEISSGVWDRQKRWEMKREVLFEAARKISEIDDAMLSNSVVLKEDRAKQEEWGTRTPSMEEQITWGETKNERLMRWSKASSEFDVSRAFVFIICGKEAAQAFSELGVCINSLAAQMIQDPGAYDSGRPELFKKILLAQKAIRKELEVDA